jgi:hypothetical protein
MEKLLKMIFKKGNDKYFLRNLFLSRRKTLLIRTFFLLWLFFQFGSGVLLGSYRYALGLDLGLQPNVGQGFISYNTSAGLGQGIDALNVENKKKKTSGLSRPGGMHFAMTNRLLISYSYFFGIDLGWLETIYGKSGTYIPYNDSSPVIKKGKYVKGYGEFNLRGFQMPITFGTMLSFWEETLFFIGGGLGYSYYMQKITLRSAQSNILNYTANSSVSGSVLFYKIFLELQHQLAGKTRETPIYLCMRFEYIFGSTGYVKDTMVKSDYPKTSKTGLVSNDSVMVNLGGYRLSIGINFHIAISGGEL